jgi:hypothetical protein
MTDFVQGEKGPGAADQTDAADKRKPAKGKEIA